MNEPSLDGKRIYFFGKLAGATRRRAMQLVREHGGAVAQTLSPSVNLVVIGEKEALSREGDFWLEELNEQTQSSFERGTLDILGESAFWDLLTHVDSQTNFQPLFTAVMLAEMVNLPLATIRLWDRKGLITPAKTVRNLSYYDFQEVLTAKALRDLLRGGLSANVIEKRLRSIERIFPDLQRPLAQLSLIVEGKDVLLRKEETLIDQRGQRRMDFEALESEHAPGEEGRDFLADFGVKDEPKIQNGQPLPILDNLFAGPLPDAESLCELALVAETEGNLHEALAMFRAALAAGGPHPKTCFHIAELLYRLGDLTAARERFYMVLELDEDYVEARANLGVVLAELGDWELAISSFLGALEHHPDYADVHYHLGMLYMQHNLREKAVGHFRTYLNIFPDSPWAERVRDLIESDPREWRKTR